MAALFEADLRTLLLADDGLAALVARRVDWNARPQGANVPAITLHRVTSGRSYVQAGQTGLETPIVQMDCWANTADGALALREALITVLRSTAFTTAPFQGAFIVDSRPDFLATPGPSATSLFTLESLDVRVCWQPAA